MSDLDLGPVTMGRHCLAFSCVAEPSHKDALMISHNSFGGLPLSIHFFVASFLPFATLLETILNPDKLWT